MLKMIAVTALGVLLASPVAPLQNPPAAQAASATPVKATAQNAAAFLGDWDLAGEGSNGPATFTLSVKAQDQELAVVLNTGDGVAQTVSDASMVGAALSLNVSFNNAGNDYPAVVTLTPSGATVGLHIEVAGGLAQLDGTAKKKAPK